MLIVVTGASQGIGEAIALAFAREPGAHLALLARSTGKLEGVAAACRAAGAGASVCPCDVTVEAEVNRVAAGLLAAQGAPEVVVANAGRFRPGALVETDLATFHDQLEVNLTSAFLTTRAFLPAMVERGRGHFFYLGSVASLAAYPNGAAYTVAKHALLGLARQARAETLATGVRVTTVLPGATLTPAWDGVPIPAQRLMPAEDVAEAVVGAWRLSDRTVVEEILLRPRAGEV
ncbi:MAG TPA: SDR family oxidoreductase [Thermoanaerobaculia bacterium]|nr:SDR family oxidoreductase [Thermoanaerobaculia bacterium]